MNLAILAEEALERLGEYKSFVFEGEEFTNKQVYDQSCRLQTGFGDLKTGKGVNVVLCMINNPLIYSIFGGIFRTGGTVVPVMFLLSAPELRYILSDARAEGVVTDLMSLEKTREAVQGLDHVRWLIVYGGEDRPDAQPPEYSLDTLLKSPPGNSLPRIDEDDVGIMMYTSGTTGKPKGVMLTHRNLYAQGEASSDAAELENWEVPLISISAMPMAHIFGVGVMVGGYMMPKKLVDMGSYGISMPWFDPEKFMQLLQEHKCNSMPAVPTMLSLMLHHPNNEQYDLSSLREIVSGAAPLPDELARTFMDKYGCRIRQIYGLTESAGIGSANRISKPYKPGSAGLAYCNTEIRIMDPGGNPLPTGERGEICLNGPTVMKGYFNLPDATREAMHEGGWLRTEDVGYLDEEGYLFVVDRVKDMIIKGGENIYPVELENMIYQYPGVAEASVVGVPDPTYGEDIVAFIVAAQGANLEEQSIIDYMKSLTSSFKVPKNIYFLDALPKNPVGKILKRELRIQAVEKTRSS